MRDNKASYTAYTVLQGWLYNQFDSVTAQLLDAENKQAAYKILQASKEGKKRLKRLDSPFHRLLTPILESLLMPGITMHYALRKRFIREHVEPLLAAKSVQQVVVLGSGFDTLCWCLHSKYPKANFIEVDHPATVMDKAAALFEKAGEPNNYNLLSVDFSEQNLGEELAHYHAFEPERSTIFVVEGVLMYLSQAHVMQLLYDIRNLTGNGTKLVFTAATHFDSEFNNTGPLLKYYLKMKKEAVLWTIEREATEAFLESQGWTLECQTDGDKLARVLLPSNHHKTVHKGEHINVARAL